MVLQMLGGKVNPADPGLSAAYAAAFENYEGASVLGYDDFTTVANGALSGRQPVVGPTWNTTGANLPAITSGEILTSGTGYAMMTFSKAPTYLECIGRFTGGFTGQAMTMAWARTPFDANSLNDLLHLNYGPQGFTLSARKDGGSFITLFNGVWRRNIATDGSEDYRIGMAVRGSVLTIIGPDGYAYSTQPDPRIKALSASPTVFWEPGSTAPIRAIRAVRHDEVHDNLERVLSTLDLAGAIGQAYRADGSIAGNREEWYEVRVGRTDSNARAGVTFGPVVIRTRLTAAANIGDTSIQTERALQNGSTLSVDYGNNSETVTTTANPSPLPGAGGPPFTSTVGALTKTHPVGTVVVGTWAARPELSYNAFSGVPFEFNYAVNFLGDIYRAGTKVIGTRRTGWTAATGTPDRTTFDTSTATATTVAQHLKALIDDLIAHGVIGA